MRKYVSQGRNGYGAVDEYQDGKCMRTVLSGLKPQYLADQIAGALNAAYWAGRNDAYGQANVAILSGIAKRPTTFPASTIREQVGALVAAANEVE